MTGPEDSHSSTRPISVAELLARNGTIGAPPVGGRRRRRRGNSDSVTVAELTGEIPILREHEVHDVDETEATRTIPVVADEPVAASTNGVVDHVDGVETESVDDVEVEPASETESVDGVETESVDGVEVEPASETESVDEDVDDDYVDEDVDDDYADAVADYAAHIEQRDTDDDPVDFFAPPPRRPKYSPGQRRFAPAVHGAEQMSPDPVDEDDDLFDSPVDLADEPEIEDEDTEAALEEKDNDEPPSYLRSTAGTLFGGQTVADDLARRGAPPRAEDIDLEDDEETVAAPSGMSSFLRGAWVVGQCIIAVAFGAGLFVAFDQLWKWNNIVALVLSVLVILGLVVGVRVVRKTEDIGSTLIAVAVGALVTLGPLALLQSG
ncbi:MAG TPA: hypothetical protein VER34_18400 [Mycobacterium sp.]|jgi:hypothetical protein|nr:hypothetical protein [Mycobacterium sp.]